MCVPLVPITVCTTQKCCFTGTCWVKLNWINVYFKTHFKIPYYFHIVFSIMVWFNWNEKKWMEKRLSMSRATCILLLKTLNTSPLGRGGGYLVLSVKSLLFSVDLLPKLKPMLYVLKHNPHLFFLFKKSKLSPQRYKNSKYWSSWRMVHLTPQATQASAHYHPALPFVGN